MDTYEEMIRDKINRITEENEISELISLLDKSAEYDSWDYIIKNLDAEFIDEYLFDYLYKNNICLETLAHMKLNDKHLKKLSADYEEAFITLAIRYFVSDDYSVSELINLLKECKQESVFENLYSLSDGLTEKITAVNYVISESKYLSDDFKAYSDKLYYSKVLMFSNDKNMLIHAFEENEPEYMLSLSKNINTPEYLLNKLTGISKIKYASKIRNNSRETLINIKKYKQT
ncbi:MAG: hypothetical protein K2K14_06830 [Ruminococcus sp.]|nr:hypothetical protein [Ruminococcus sp.]